ncbi:hypothetical protein PsorP6_007870 [Peronosclerospora sorghi]|uniref:Uncharacterized protein n=1 Tax=Peronosclerospora sorghi TaxID=230839 RepID=A0ACC0W9R1_9STRA|nr:hypothetical protein PsorP6_007870 [Peronosclerospora sorghi]
MFRYHIEPLILAGGFNVDNQTFRDEGTNLEITLKAHEPHRIGYVMRLIPIDTYVEIVSNLFSFAIPHTNVLVGRDGDADDNKCEAKYENSWGPHKVGVVQQTRYPGSCMMLTLASIPRQRRRESKMEEITSAIDRVVHFSGWTTFSMPKYRQFSTVLCTNSSSFGITAPYQQPNTCPTLRALVNQVSVFTASWSDANGTPKMAMRDLSDHYPVLGKFTFPLTRGKGMDNDPSTYHLDGCLYHIDCALGDSICLCKGRSATTKVITRRGLISTRITP